MNRYINIIFTFLFGLLTLPSISAGIPLIDPAKFGENQLESTTPEHDSSLSFLTDDDLNSVFITSNSVTDEQHYLIVKFPEPIGMSKENENLVVVVNRPLKVDGNAHTVRNPTAMEVHYSLDGKNWEKEVLCRVYFTYRGAGTTELSEPLPYSKLNERINLITPGKTINDVKALKFIVTMNNGKFIIGNDNNGRGIRPMILAGFQIYLTETGERVVDQWVDRFHLDGDINMRYFNYKFEPTQGVLHPANRNIWGTNGEGSLNNLGGWENFEKNDSAKWTADEAALLRYGISMPDYSFITKENDPLKAITNPSLKLQRTATVEHVVYAVQGEPIALIPYYTLPETANYQENFIHWYDYKTGGQVTDQNHTELLDFSVDASGVFRSENHGWYTSKLFHTDEKTEQVEKISIYTVDDYKNLLNKVNSQGFGAMNAELMNDLDFGGDKLSPIGTASSPWTGTFKGNNHTIKNLTVENYNTEGTGIFGNAAGGAHIENLIIDESCSINGAGWVGVVGRFRRGGTLTMQGVVNNAKMTSTGNIGGLLGGIESQTPLNVTLNITNCAFNGTITNKKSQEQGLVAGWLGRGSSNTDNLRITVNFKNIIITGTLNNPDAGMYIYRYKKDQLNNYIFNIDLPTCFVATDTSDDKLDFTAANIQGWTAFDAAEVNTEEFLKQFGGEWVAGENGFPVSKLFDTPIGDSNVSAGGSINPDRKYGTFATFMHPRDPFAEGGDLRELCQDEFIIACDMAQDFSIGNNVDERTETIIEPTIQFRHIFRVKDGVKFAKENMANKKGNEAFIKKNLRHITATADTYFQVRLDYPYPVEPTTRGVFYYQINDKYKINDTEEITVKDYRRICSRYFRVWKDGKLIQDRDEKTGKMWVDSPDNLVDKPEQAYFYATASFKGQGSREVGNITYYLHGGDGNYYRMMSCDAENAQQGHYTVQVVGTDYEGHTIKLADSPDTDLLVQQFEITFLPKTSAVFATEEDLEKEDYKNIRNNVLEQKYTLSDKIDFDEYRYIETQRKDFPDITLYLTEIEGSLINSTTNKIEYQKGKYFRWPLSWEQSNYGFGYNARHDYAMQMIVDNQAVTPYHSLPYRADLKKNFGRGIGLFDRLFYDSKGTKKGYFYYVNAADDPGIIARLKLKKFCAGSKIHVSCWVSEFSESEESANLAFNFVARMKNGERIPLHSHITGYVEQGQKSHEKFERRGKWLYVYSSFVPILTDKEFEASELSHYEVELDNNAKSSHGADYAVDDIRVYTVNPTIIAEQISPVCLETTTVDMKISADFDMLLQSLEMEKETNIAKAESIDLYYTFLDKKQYDKLMATEGVSYQEAFNQSVLRYKYDDENESYYGKLQFYNCFEKHMPYDSEESASENKAMGETIDEVDYIVFETHPTNLNMRPGKEYIAVILTKPEGTFKDGMEPGADDFLVYNNCTKKCEFTIKSSHIIKIDGEVQKQSDEVNACRNQSPVVQVDLAAMDKNNPGKIEIVEENAVFDWFDGSMDEFVEIEENGTTLWDALGEFRKLYPDATDLSYKPAGGYTTEMKAIIEKYSKLDPEGKIRPKLYLAKSSYVFPPLELPVGVTEINAYVLAVPIPRKIGDNLLLCTQPQEVHVKVKQRAPRLAQGISTIDYPDAINDVPLRISLKQIKAARSKDDPVTLPFRIVRPVTSNVSDMRAEVEGSLICLVATNDPEYKDLQGEGKKESELWAVGEVLELKANKNHVEDGKVALMFKDNINFKEGYEYTLRFTFQEDEPEVVVEPTDPPVVTDGPGGTTGDTGGSEDDAEDDPKEETEEDPIEVCTGHMVFTLKIVPEYQKWTGDANTLNWNNDANWSRVTSDDILIPASDKAAYADLVTNGNNTQSFSYAPLEFTKVVIPHGATVPALFEATSESSELFGQDYKWDNNPSENAEAGDATDLVQYDMVQDVIPGVRGTQCKPWQAHWCEQIHFEPYAEIAHQQHLNYKRAWVDMEVSPTRWYTLSSPLQSVVAGDMYLPTADARQSTQRFKDITFDTNSYNRFHPAVFQRSWNQASATVYNYNNLPKDTTEVRVLTTWSNVYNDVNVPYTRGHGFSIKTDLSDVSLGSHDKVLFRLPKADANYWYYTDGASPDKGDNTGIDRSMAYRLNEVGSEFSIEVKAATEQNKLFLVGNPFMAHIDMQEFLDANKEVIEPKFWILEGNRQGAAVMTDAYELKGTEEDMRYLAPMQGFFVEAIEPGKSLFITFNEATMAKTVNEFTDLQGVLTRSSAKSREGDTPSGLRITAVESGSAALLLVDENADTRYLPAEDVMFVTDETLEAPSLVYTVANGVATTINSLPEITSTEVGLTAIDDNTTSTLLFEGVDSSAGLMLYDATTGIYTDLYDGMEVTVQGSASHRLYIVNSNLTPVAESSLEILQLGDRVTVATTEDAVMARVYDVSGRVIDSYDAGGQETTFTLPRGIFIVEASDSVSKKTQKVLVK